MIPYGKHIISKQDIDSVVDVLKSDYLTQGNKLVEFESVVSEYCSADYSIAFNSATSALHIACLSLGVQKGDVVWTSPITFVASANCALYCGAEIDFVDIDALTYNMSYEALRNKLEHCRDNQLKLPKVVVPVHLSGQSCDMEAIKALSVEYGFFIIEDASHAIGGKYLNCEIGSCNYSDITVFSFHPVKIITTAEGGAAVTNSQKLAEKMALLRSHGITRSPELMTKDSDGPWYYQQLELGYNYRMTEIQAALGISQFSKLDEFINIRHNLANVYEKLLSSLPVVTPFQNKKCYSSYHLYIIKLKLKEINKSHLQIFNGLREAGIGVNLHYIPVHTQPFYKSFGFQEGDYPEAEKYYKEALSLPLHPSLTESQLHYISNTLSDLLT